MANPDDMLIMADSSFDSKIGIKSADK